MVRPTNFTSNPDTAGSNTFQHSDLSAQEAQDAAVKEFDEYVELLREAGVDVMVIQDRTQPHTPDSIFPNNWITTHEDGTVILYPMEALNRRLERRRDILECIGEKFDIKSLMDFSSYESKEFFLEGTGSMVLDRVHRIAYVCRSSRSHEMVEDAFAKVMQYRTVWFTAVDKSNMPIYHTNVMKSARIQTLVPDDADALAQQSYADSVTPSVSASSSTIRFGDVAVSGTITGVGAQYFRVRGLEMAEGQAFDQAAVARLAQDVVIDNNTKIKLFGSQTPALGQVIMIQRCGVSPTDCRNIWAK